MEGLHIFNQTEIMSTPTGLLLALLFFAIIFLAIGITKVSEKGSWIRFTLILAGILSLIILAVISNNPKPTGKFEYTVTIDKDVDLLEFNEKYEIVSQEGELWIIKDK